jgi:hypothetical protein
MNSDSPYINTGAMALADGRARLIDPNSTPTRPNLLHAALNILQNGTPELIAAVDEGRMSPTRASRIANLDAETQIEEANAAFFEHNRFRSRLHGKGSTTSSEVDIDTPIDTNWKKSQNYAMQAARCAITQLEPIPRNNKFRNEAFDIVVKWINNNRKDRK